MAVIATAAICLSIGLAVPGKAETFDFTNDSLSESSLPQAGDGILQPTNQPGSDLQNPSPDLQNPSPTNSAQPLRGIGIGDGQVSNRFIFHYDAYVGECTGFSNYRYYEDIKILVPSRLIGKGIPEPQKGRRVRIINRSNAGAYTDREWEKSPGLYATFVDSEAFKMGIARGQDNGKLALTIGNNDLITVFYEGGFGRDNFKELSTAHFIVLAQASKITRTVNRQLSTPVLECAANPSISGSAITADNCPGKRQRVQYLTCPSWTSGGAPKERRVIETVAGPAQPRRRSSNSIAQCMNDLLYEEKKVCMGPGDQVDEGCFFKGALGSSIKVVRVRTGISETAAVEACRNAR